MANAIYRMLRPQENALKIKYMRQLGLKYTKPSGKSCKMCK